MIDSKSIRDYLKEIGWNNEEIEEFLKNFPKEEKRSYSRWGFEKLANKEAKEKYPEEQEDQRFQHSCDVILKDAILHPKNI